MRMEKKKMDVGEKTSLTERKVELLEFFGFVWAQSCKGELGWENRFCELKKFKEMHGHCTLYPWFRVCESDSTHPTLSTDDTHPIAVSLYPFLRQRPHQMQKKSCAGTMG